MNHVEFLRWGFGWARHGDANYTSSRGYTAKVYSFEDLCRVFGEPDYIEDVGPDSHKAVDPSAEPKVTSRWTVVFDDGLVGTIYDWKERYGLLPYQVPDRLLQWNIGGKDDDSFNHDPFSHESEINGRMNAILQDAEIKGVVPMRRRENAVGWF